MLMSTVIAVALGLAPVQKDGLVAPSQDNYAKIVGRYSQRVDGDGTTHIHGFNAATGKIYWIDVDRQGNVEALVGDDPIVFQVKQAA